MGKKCKVKLDVGTVYQKEEGGTYYFRYQVQHERKCVSLKTSNQEEALEKARKLLPIIQGSHLRPRQSRTAPRETGTPAASLRNLERLL